MNLTPPTQLARLFDVALWLAGAGHFLVAVASVQVPGQLKWNIELARLSPFNRKLMWVYGGTILMTILAFGGLTLCLHREMLKGDRAALGLMAFIALFWTLRIVIDFAYFEHSDWPKGKRFVIGHALLTSLFASLALTYWGAFTWNLTR